MWERFFNREKPETESYVDKIPEPEARGIISLVKIEGKESPPQEVRRENYGSEEEFNIALLRSDQPQRGVGIGSSLQGFVRNLPIETGKIIDFTDGSHTGKVEHILKTSEGYIITTKNSKYKFIPEKSLK